MNTDRNLSYFEVFADGVKIGKIFADFANAKRYCEDAIKISPNIDIEIALITYSPIKNEKYESYVPFVFSVWKYTGGKVTLDCYSGNENENIIWRNDAYQVNEKWKQFVDSVETYLSETC